jgi:hypothetical protein
MLRVASNSRPKMLTWTKILLRDSNFGLLKETPSLKLSRRVHPRTILMTSRRLRIFNHNSKFSREASSHKATHLPKKSLKLRKRLKMNSKIYLSFKLKSLR